MKRLWPMIISKVHFTILVLVSLLFLSAIIINAQTKKYPGEENFVFVCLKSSFLNVDVNDATAAVRVWGQTLEKELNLNVKFDIKMCRDINDLINSPLKDNFGYMLLNSVDYLKYKSKLKLYPSFISNSCVEYVILASRDKYSSLKDLQNKKLGLMKSYYNPLPEMWLEVLLGKAHLKIKDNFFSNIKEYTSESQLILTVFFDQNDLCVVSKNSFETMKELNPQVGKKLIELEHSACYNIELTCFSSSSIKYSYKDKLVDDLIKVDSYPEGRQILTLMKTDKIRLYIPGDLDTVEGLLNNYNALKNKSGKSKSE